MVEYIGGPVDGLVRAQEPQPVQGQLSLFTPESGCTTFAYCYQFDGFHYIFTGILNESQIEQLLSELGRAK